MICPVRLIDTVHLTYDVRKGTHIMRTVGMSGAVRHDLNMHVPYDVRKGTHICHHARRPMEAAPCHGAAGSGAAAREAANQRSRCRCVVWHGLNMRSRCDVRKGTHKKTLPMVVKSA